MIDWAASRIRWSTASGSSSDTSALPTSSRRRTLSSSAGPFIPLDVDQWVAFRIRHQENRALMDGTPAVLRRSDFDALLQALLRRDYTIIGPTIRDRAIVYDEIEQTADLPVGWTDEQDAGRYRLARRDDEALFGYAVGPQSWKQF